MTDRDDIVALLAERGARDIDHPGGNLLDHLIRTSDLLSSWSASEEVVVAGLAHAAYGTDGAPTALFELQERSRVAEAIGDAAEAIVYRYASCDRKVTLPAVEHGRDVPFRDRFTGRTLMVTGTALRSFAELTVANELDLARHNEPFRREHGPALWSLFSGWLALVSAEAYIECQRLLRADAGP